MTGSKRQVPTGEPPAQPPTARRHAELDPRGADSGRSIRERLLVSAPQRDADVPAWFRRAERASRLAVVTLVVVALSVSLASVTWLRVTDAWESLDGWSGTGVTRAVVASGAVIDTWYLIPRSPTAVGSLLLLSAAVFAATSLTRPGAIAVAQARATALVLFVLGATAAAFAGTSFRFADVSVLPMMAIGASLCELGLLALLARTLARAIDLDGSERSVGDRLGFRRAVIVLGVVFAVLHVEPARVLMITEDVVIALAGPPARSFGPWPEFALLIALGVPGLAALVRIASMLRAAMRDAPVETWTIDACRARDAACLDCGYDLTMSGDRCPECAGPAPPLAVRSMLGLAPMRALVASIAILLCAPIPTFLFAGGIALLLEVWRRIDVALGLRLQAATARVISFELVQPVVFVGALLFAGTIVVAIAGHALRTALLSAEFPKHGPVPIGWPTRIVLALAATLLATLLGPASFRAIETFDSIERAGAVFPGRFDFEFVLVAVAGSVTFAAVLLVMRSISAVRLVATATGARGTAGIALALLLVSRVCAIGVFAAFLAVVLLGFIGALAPGVTGPLATVRSLIGVVAVLLGPIGLGVAGSALGFATGIGLLRVAREQALRGRSEST